MKNDNNLMLSPHFSLSEMVRSGVAIEQHISNEPSAAAVECLKTLCNEVLEPLRRRFGVIRITSGYRSAALNRAVGGVSNSQHCRGEAADIHLSSVGQGQQMYHFITTQLQFDQLLFEHRMRNGCCWLHVSYTRRRPNRNTATPYYPAR